VHGAKPNSARPHRRAGRKRDLTGATSETPTDVTRGTVRFTRT